MAEWYCAWEEKIAIIVIALMIPFTSFLCLFCDDDNCKNSLHATIKFNEIVNKSCHNFFAGNCNTKSHQTDYESNKLFLPFFIVSTSFVCIKACTEKKLKYFQRKMCNCAFKLCQLNCIRIHAVFLCVFPARQKKESVI